MCTAADKCVHECYVSLCGSKQVTFSLSLNVFSNLLLTFADYFVQIIFRYSEICSEL